MSTHALKNEVNMTSVPIFSGLLKVAIPIVVMNVLQSVFNLIDTTMLGGFTGDGGVGAVSATAPLISLITGFLIGLATGSNVIVARHIAKGDKEKTEMAIGTSIWLAIISGVAFMVIGVVFAKTFLTWMNVSENLLENAVPYFALYFVGCPLLLLYNFCASILRAAGDSKRPMYFLILGGVLKILINFLLLKFTNLHSKGLALATIVSWAVTAGLCFWILLKGEGSVKFKWSCFRIYKQELKDVLIIGVPTGIQVATYNFANVIMSTTVNSFGDHATTGIGIANIFDGIIYQIANSPSFAVMPFISQNFAVKNHKRVKEVFFKGCLIAAGFCFIAGSLSAIFSEQLSSLMSKTPEVIAYSKQKMIIISSTYFICGIQDVLAATLRGMGRSIIPTVSALVFTCFLRIFWVYLIFPLNPDLTFLYLVWPLGWILAIGMLGISFYIVYKKFKKECS